VWFTFNVIPEWYAPNLITATGFSLIISSYSMLYYYDSSLNQPMPSWVYLFWAVSIFLYQVGHARLLAHELSFEGGASC
jgi:hypothetical protein